MESHGTVCEWDGDKLTAWISTQGINGARENFATALNIPQANVRVICQHMGGGFGSKALSVGAEGLDLRQAREGGGAPVKLMLDRKEEHLATGNRPSAAARVKAGVSADGIITAFDAESWGTGGAGAAAGSRCRTSIESRIARDAQGRLHQHRSAAADAGARPSAGLVHHRDHDGRARRQGERGSVEFRIKNLPPEAPNAMWRAYLREGARKFGWDKRHPTGDKTAGPIKTGMGVAICTWGGGGRGPAQAHCEIASDGSVVMRIGTQDIGTGTRTLVAMVTADRSGSRRRRSSGDRRHAVRREPAVGRQHDGREHQSRDSRRGGQGARRAEGEGRAGARRRCGVARRRRRPHSRRDTPARGMSWASLQADRAAADRRRWRLAARPVVGDHQRRAVRRGDRRYRDRHHEADADSRAQDCGLVVSRLTAESQTYGGVIGR